MTKLDRIEKLRKAIASETTPDYMKPRMQEMIAELEAPEPEPLPPPPPPVVVKKKPRPKPKKKAAAPPPPPPPRTFTAEEKAQRMEDYNRRLARKKANQE